MIDLAGDGRSNRERMLAGDPYIPDDPDNHRNHLKALRLTADFIDTYPRDEAAALWILTELLGKLGPGAIVKRPLYVDYGSQLFIGDGTFINTGLIALDAAPITIGKDCQFGPAVQLLTASHPLDPAARREKWKTCCPIRVGDNAWIGAGAIVLGGVTIGEDAVVRAGSVVTRDVPARSVVVGSPARVIRTL